MTDSVAPEASDTPDRRPVSRRTLVKAAAWAVPVIAIAAPAPAFAASPKKPTNGCRARFKIWLTGSSSDRHVRLIGDDPNHPAYGFFQVTGTVTGQVITNVKITVQLNRDIADSAWTAVHQQGENIWAKPKKIAGPDADGFYTYQLDYKIASTAATNGGTNLDARYNFDAGIGSGGIVARNAVWSVVISEGASPTASATSTNVVTLNNSGNWQYILSPGVTPP